MGKDKHPTEDHHQTANHSRFDLLSFLGRLGLKTLRMKLFLIVLLLTGLSIIITCLVAYLGFYNAIESSADLRRVAGSNAETVELLIFENIQFVRSIASDDLLINAAEDAAIEAERLGISGVSDERGIAELETRFKETRVVRRNAAADNFLQNKRAFKGIFDRLFFTDRYGLNVAMTTMTEDFVQSDEKWWQETMKTGWYIEDVKFDKPTGTFSIEICAAIPSRRGGYGGVLKAKYNLQDAQDFISRFKQYQSGYAFAINPAGQIVLHPNKELRNLSISEVMGHLDYDNPQFLQSELERRATDKEGGLLHWKVSNRNTGGTTNRLLSYEVEKGLTGNGIQFPGFGWLFIVDNSEREVTAPAQSMLKLIAGTGIVSMLFFGLIAFIFTKSISKKVEDILGVTEQVSAGNTNARANVTTGDEIERVANGFNHMMDRLEETAQREREQKEALSLSEEKYRNILENIEDGYYEVALNGTITFFNDSLSKILGFPREDLMGLDYRRYVDPDSVPIVKESFNTVFRTDQSKRNFSYRVIRKDGVKRFIEASISLMKDNKGEPIGFRGILRDVTERRIAENTFQKSLDEFLEIASSVSEGDLTIRANESEDTLGKIIQSVNRMLDNFSVMLTQVKQIGLSVSSSATQIQAASEQIAAGSQRQADEITNTSSAVEEMAASMNQVSKNAEASAEAARRALDMAENGDRAVRYTTETMKRIETGVQQTADKMRVLGARSSEISEILNLIDEIAAQTNLLALNAAIEAAHAGQAGLGFSVVADEIRKLAERSARATRDVGSLIKTVQSEISEALSAMEGSFNEVKTGTQVADEASETLRDISTAVRQSSELMEEISAASEEQARITTNLAEAMQTISAITLETSAGAHQTAQTLQSMVDLSEQLNRAISQFKVKQDGFPFESPLPSSAGNGGVGLSR